MGLKLYSGITPNSNNIHYLYSDIATFKTALSSYLLDTITLDNYRINSGVIKVAPTEQLTSANYKNVSYAINENDNVCYIVKSCESRFDGTVGYFIFDCDVDYWGTYIAQATLSHINVLRCNRNIDIGIYDDIKATKDNTIERFEIPNGQYVTTPEEDKTSFKFENVYIVFCVTFNVEQTAFGSTSATGMYAIRLDSVYNRYITDNPTKTNANPLDIAKAWVGGIYGIKGTNQWGLAVSLDAKVTKAYFVCDIAGDFQFGTYINILTKSIYGDYDANNPIGCFSLVNMVYHWHKTLQISPNYNYYVGTINNGLKLTRTTEQSIDIEYVISVNDYDIQITVKQGDNQLDITNEFEITLTLNDGDVTNLSEIKQVLKMTLSAGEKIATGDYAGFGMSVANDIIDLSGHHYYGKQLGRGDGYITFIDWGNKHLASLGEGIKYPYAITKSSSVTDEEVNARNKGAYFNCYVSSLASIFTFSLLGTGSNDDPTYLQAKVQIDNVPKNAITEISTRLNKGVYLVKL